VAEDDIAFVNADSAAAWASADLGLRRRIKLAARKIDLFT
jgi:hypothetical protein